MRNRKKSRGFTLLELMMVIAILAIVTVIGVPSFSSMIKNSRLTAAVNNLTGVLAFARAEAARRGRNIQVRAIDEDLSNGLRVWFDIDEDEEFDSGEELRLIEMPPPPFTIFAEVDGEQDPDISLSFSARGSVSGVDSLLTIKLCDDRSGTYGKELQLLATGVLRTRSGVDCSEG